MSIYNPTWLYIKKHNVTGLKYFGKTSSKDPKKYKGSGMYWLNHLKKHGNDVTTVWCQLFNTFEELTEYCKEFSKEHNIVESKDQFGNKIWANLVPETGTDGGGVKGRPKTEEHKAKMRKPKPSGFGEKVSERLSGKKRTPEHEANLKKAREGIYTADVRKKMSETHKMRHRTGVAIITKGNLGKKWYNNGLVELMSKECPENFFPGRLTIK